MRLIGDTELLRARCAGVSHESGAYDRDAPLALQIGTAGRRAFVRHLIGPRRAGGIVRFSQNIVGSFVGGNVVGNTVN